jgi:hypothetical protein
MHLGHVVTAGWFAIALPLVSVAGQSTSSTQSAAPDPARWSFSLGVDPTNLDLHTPEPGVQARMVANLTRSWQSGSSKWTRHISLMVGADAPREVQPFGALGPLCDCPMRFSRRYAGITAGASYDLFRVSRFTPYIMGGTGFYVDGYRRSPVRDILTPSEAPFYANGADSHDAFFTRSERRCWPQSPAGIPRALSRAKGSSIRCQPTGSRGQPVQHRDSVLRGKREAQALPAENTATACRLLRQPRPGADYEKNNSIMCCIARV